MRFFTKKKEEPNPEQLREALAINRNAIQGLTKRHLHLENRIKQCMADATQQLSSGDRSGALMSLQRKKLCENELKNLGNARLTLERQAAALESANCQKNAIAALEAGVEAQKRHNNVVTVDRLDALLADMDEQQGVQKDITSLFQRSAAENMDKVELDEELRQLEECVYAEKLANAPLPGIATSNTVRVGQHQAAVSSSAPTTRQILLSDERSDEELLQQLQAELE